MGSLRRNKWRLRSHWKITGLLCCVVCAIPKYKDSKRKLDPIETEYNNFLGSTRSTIEQVFGYLKTWAILGTIYRVMLLKDTGYHFLSTAIRFCCELYNARFTIFGSNKRNIRVYARDEDGVPLCPPHNLTTENLRLRSYLHHQLSKLNRISHEQFYLCKDIDSKNNHTSFRTGDHIWVFDENIQGFTKANVTGCVDGLFNPFSQQKGLQDRG